MHNGAFRNLVKWDTILEVNKVNKLKTVQLINFDKDLKSIFFIKLNKNQFGWFILPGFYHTTYTLHNYFLWVKFQKYIHKFNSGSILIISGFKLHKGKGR